MPLTGLSPVGSLECYNNPLLYTVHYVTCAKNFSVPAASVLGIKQKGSWV